MTHSNEGIASAAPLKPPFADLTPTRLLDAVESAGWRTDGRILALNSFENRVYQVGLETGDLIVVKVYRPGRWTDAQIREEHSFTEALAALEIPVVPPLPGSPSTLHHHASYRLAIYPRRGGRAPELDAPGILERLGRIIGRIHALAPATRFVQRPDLTVQSHGHEPCAWLQTHGVIPPDLIEPWRAVTEQCLRVIEDAFDALPQPFLRLHGDLHPGNVLWTDTGPHVLDFDDARNGPAVQDLWMLLSGDAPTMAEQLSELLRGYQTFMDFDPRQITLIEPLRTLRLMHYSAWLARRWHDPAFPHAFPWFGTARYWQNQILELREQLAAMAEPLLLQSYRLHQNQAWF